MLQVRMISDQGLHDIESVEVACSQQRGLSVLISLSLIMTYIRDLVYISALGNKVFDNIIVALGCRVDHHGIASIGLN
jgi:hypothetical protein